MLLSLTYLSSQLRFKVLNFEVNLINHFNYTNLNLILKLKDQHQLKDFREVLHGYIRIISRKASQQ
jgi:hypothetical protein